MDDDTDLFRAHRNPGSGHNFHTKIETVQEDVKGVRFKHVVDDDAELEWGGGYNDADDADNDGDVDDDISKKTTS